MQETADLATGAVALRRQLTERALSALTAYTTEADYPKVRRESTFVVTDAAYLTPEELTTIVARIKELFAEARARRPAGPGRVGSAEHHHDPIHPVRLFAFGVPESPPVLGSSKRITTAWETD